MKYHQWELDCAGAGLIWSFWPWSTFAMVQKRSHASCLHPSIELAFSLLTIIG